jgi:hypothetical protein
MPGLLITDDKGFKVKTNQMHVSVIAHPGYQEIQEYRSGVWAPLGTTPNPVNISVVLP